MSGDRSSVSPIGGGRRVALLIAADTYHDPGLSRLRAPAGDARALAAVLGDANVGAFTVRLVVNATRDEVERAIERFFGDAVPDDLLLLYISGHGVLSQDRGLYFATPRTELSLLRSTAVADRFIVESMRHSRARSIVLLLDCCHSGAFGSGLRPKSPPTVDVERRFEGRGRITLTASSELEYAFEDGSIDSIDAEAGSIFTRFLVEGLRTGDADRDQDGLVMIDELYEYVHEHVRASTAHQTPGKSGSAYGDLVVARSPHRGVALELRLALKSPIARLRAAALEALAERALEERALAPAAEQAIREALEDGDREVADVAWRVLADIAALDRPGDANAAPGETLDEPVEDRPASAPSPLTARVDDSTSAHVCVWIENVGTAELTDVAVLDGGGDAIEEPFALGPGATRSVSWERSDVPQDDVTVTAVDAEGFLISVPVALPPQISPTGPPSPPALLRLRHASDSYTDEPILVRHQPGTVDVVKALVRNQSSLVDSFTLWVEGLPEAWYAVEPSTVFLLPFGAGTTYEQEVEIRVQAPRTHEARAAMWTARVLVASTVTSEVVSVPVSIEMTPFRQVDLELEPSGNLARRTARYSVVVGNLGNVPETVALGFGDTEASVRGTFAADALGVEPGEHARTRLTVRAVEAHLFGAAALRRFQVTGADQRVSGVLRQRAWLSPAALVVLLAAALAVAVGLLLFL